MSESADGLTLRVMIEIGKGSRNRYEYDKERERVRFHRLPFSPVH